MQAHQAVFSVSRMGRIFEVSRSGVYDGLSRPESARQQAKPEIFEYIEGFYHRQRKPSTLGYRTPHEFDQRHRKAA